MSSTRTLIDSIRASVEAGETVVDRAFADFNIHPRGPTLEYVPDPPRPSLASEPVATPAVPHMIQHANELAWCGCRPIALAVIVTRIRERFREFEAAGEASETWHSFVARHLPTIGIDRVNALVESVTRQPVEPDAAPVSALDRAIAAVRAEPAKSNRAIAKEIQVDESTVRSARKKLREAAADSAPDSAGVTA